MIKHFQRHCWRMLFLAAPLAGCGGAEDGYMLEGDVRELEEPDDVGGAENIATAASALCSDNGIADVSGPLTAPPYSPPLSYSIQSTSPDASYGSAACSGRYVVDATGIDSLPDDWHLSVSAALEDTSSLTSQAQCEAASVNMIVYAQVFGVWISAGEYSSTGDWNASTNKCSVFRKVFINYSVMTKVRVAAKAERPYLYGTFPDKVLARVELANLLFEE